MEKLKASWDTAESAWESWKTTADRRFLHIAEDELHGAISAARALRSDMSHEATLGGTDDEL